MIDTSQVKEMIQQRALNLSGQYDNLMLSWCTGASKTLAAIKCMEKWWNLHCMMGAPSGVYLIVKEVAHEENWRREFVKWGYEWLLTRVTIFCYASLHNYKGKSTGVIVLDECHALSEYRESSLETIGCQKIISLSATVQHEVRERIKDLKEGKQFHEYHISLKDGINMGLVPEPKVYINYVDLDTPQRREYERYTGEFIKYEAMVNDGKMWAENKMLQTAMKRKRLIAASKSERAKEMVSYLNGRRFIVFTSTIKQCMELGGDKAVNSTIGRVEAAEVIADFNERKIDEIYAVRMLRESMNLEGIEGGLIVQLDGASGSGAQMMGRMLRSLAPEIYIIVARKTKDEDYLKRCLKDVPKGCVEEFILPESEKKGTFANI